MNRPRGFEILRELEIALQNETTTGIEINCKNLVNVEIEGLLLLKSSIQVAPGSHPPSPVRREIHFTGVQESLLPWFGLCGFPVVKKVPILVEGDPGEPRGVSEKKSEESVRICIRCEQPLEFTGPGLVVCRNCGAHQSMDPMGRSAFYEMLKQL